MVKASEWRQKHGYAFKVGSTERKCALRNLKRHKDNEGQVVHAREFLIPGIKKAEPLDAYGWITLTTRVSTLVGVIYLVGTALL
jgi:hypothetical protein